MGECIKIVDRRVQTSAEADYCQGRSLNPLSAASQASGGKGETKTEIMSAARPADESHHTPVPRRGRKWPSLTLSSLLFTCRNGFDAAFCLFGLRKCIIGAGCQGDGTIRPQIKEFAAATITCLSCDKTHARPPATTSQHRSWKLKLFQTQIQPDRFIVGEIVCPCHAGGINKVTQTAVSLFSLQQNRFL